MKQYIAKEFNGFVSASIFAGDKSTEDWLNEVISESQKDGYSVESITQSMSSVGESIYHSVILIMSK